MLFLTTVIEAVKRQTLRPFAERFASSRKGNVAIIAAVSMLPISLALGAGIDYTIQKRGQDQLAGIADATALVAVTPTMMAQSEDAATKAAQTFWNSQAATVYNVNAPTAVVSVLDTPTPNGASVVRNVSVTWSATSNTFFFGLVGKPTLVVGSTSKASSSKAPQINFYLLVDTSPSMAIAATSTGIQTMVNNTSAQGGCAFACHETNPSYDNLQNPSVSNPVNGQTCCVGQDNYALARALGVTLRIDLVNYAVSNLMSTAASTANTNLTNYGVSVSTVDYHIGQLYQTGNISADLTTAQQYVGTLQQLEVAYNGCVFITNCNYAGAGNDQDSFLDFGLSTLNTLNSGAYNAATGPGFQMYAPGKGTSNSGDTPQEVLFIITDGVVDESINGGRIMDPINTIVDNCSAIKAEGIRIAFLYLTYNPLPTNSFYNSNVAPFQSNIATAAQTCASPGLYQQVNTDGDVSAALNILFQQAVATAHLTQ